MSGAKRHHKSKNVGVKNGRSKLKPKDIQLIRRLFKKDSKQFTIDYLAKVFEVDRRTVRCVVDGTTWKHVKG